MQSESEKLAMEEEKKPYQTPQLIQHGTVEEITFDADAEISGFVGDADDPF